MRVCHPDGNPGVDRNISQQLVAFHNILVDPTTRKFTTVAAFVPSIVKIQHIFVACVTPDPCTNPWTTSGNDFFSHPPFPSASFIMRGRILRRRV